MGFEPHKLGGKRADGGKPGRALCNLVYDAHQYSSLISPVAARASADACSTTAFSVLELRLSIGTDPFCAYGPVGGSTPAGPLSCSLCIVYHKTGISQYLS